VTATATPGAPLAPSPPGRTWARDLLRAVAGPVICAVVLTGLLAAWVATGGAGTLTRVRLQVTLAAVPMRAFTPQAAAAVGSATTFLTIKNLTGTPDELVAARSPIAHRVVLTERSGPAAPRTVIADMVVPAHGTLTLSPFGDDLVLQDPAPFETSAAVPLTLTFRHAGTVTIDALVTAPGTP
jgi:periplasmic copper chaperone A